MKKALIHETSDARELSMLLMAWALAVAGRYFSEVAFHISDFQPWLCVMRFSCWCLPAFWNTALSCGNKMTSCCRAVAL